MIEKPGHSNHSVAAPVKGVVEKLLVIPGQAVSPGTPLVQLRVADDALSEAQLEL